MPDPGAFVLRFGKHKGKTLSQVPAGYVTWLDGLPDLRPDMRAAVDAYLRPPELPMEGREPEESAPAAQPPRRRSAPRNGATSSEPAACCAKCGLRGTEARPLVHEACATDDVPF